MLNRSDNRYLTHAGKTQTLREWSDETGIGMPTLCYRLLKSGWSVERALTEIICTQSEAGRRGAESRWSPR